MYIFSRTRRAASGQLAEATAAAAEIAQKVTQATGNDIYTWSVRYSEPFGTLMWSSRVSGQAELLANEEKMYADQGVTDMVKEMDHLFDGPATDRLMRVVSGTAPPDPKPFIGITEAVMASGHYDEAVAYGVAMEQFVAAECGLATMFAVAVYGGFVDVAWLAGADTMEELDAFWDWRMENAEFHDLVKKNGGLFVEGSGRNGLIRRVG